MFKTVKWNTGSAAARFRSTRKKIKENRKKNKASSSQAGGPAHKESGSKHALEKPQIIFRTILEFEKDE
jgi:hypothetical protein